MDDVIDLDMDEDVAVDVDDDVDVDWYFEVDVYVSDVVRWCCDTFCCAQRV